MLCEHSIKEIKTRKMYLLGSDAPLLISLLPVSPLLAGCMVPLLCSSLVLWYSDVWGPFMEVTCIIAYPNYVTIHPFCCWC